MNTKRFNDVVEKQLNICKDILCKKSVEYNKSNADRLDAFKAAAVLSGTNQKKALAGMMAKHTISIYQMCNDDKEYTLEKWTEKITDHINYLLILKAIIMEDNDGLLKVLDEMKAATNIDVETTESGFGEYIDDIDFLEETNAKN